MRTSPTHLPVNARANPIGIGTPGPEFSWHVAQSATSKDVFELEHSGSRDVRLECYGVVQSQDPLDAAHWCHVRRTRHALQRAVLVAGARLGRLGHRAQRVGHFTHHVVDADGPRSTATRRQPAGRVRGPIERGEGHVSGEYV